MSDSEPFECGSEKSRDWQSYYQLFILVVLVILGWFCTRFWGV